MPLSQSCQQTLSPRTLTRLVDVLQLQPLRGTDLRSSSLSLQTSYLTHFCYAAEEGKPGESQPDLPADAGSHTIEKLDKLRNSKGSQTVAQIRGNLQKTMQADAAVFRTQACS